MDPNTALMRLRKQAKLALADKAEGIDPIQFAEQFLALDAWLSKGGFAPADWYDGHRKATDGSSKFGYVPPMERTP
jgi:hypothetical protein